MATQAPGHFSVLDRQGRLSLTVIDDLTLQTTSLVTENTLVPVSRLESADDANKTKVDQVVEIGTNAIVGGVVSLGEFTGKLTRQATSTKLLGLMSASKQSTVPGATTTWNYFSFGSSQFDYCRLLADGTGVIYAFWVALDAIITKVTYTGKNTGMTTEEYELKGPQLAYVNGYPIAKTYVIQTADVTAKSIPISSTFAGGLITLTPGAEIPNRKLPPVAGQPPDSLYDSGRINFFKVKLVPMTVNETIGGVTYGVGSNVRYRENQDYNVIVASMAAPGLQTAVTTTVISPASGNVINYRGPELIVGASIMVDPGAVTQEVCFITAITLNTISFTTTAIHSATGCIIGLAPASGYCLYNCVTGNLVLGDALTAGDVIKVLFASYDTDSIQKTIATTKFDTTDPAGIPGRLTPVTILGAGLPRVQDATMTITIDRKQVQGLGENEIIYGTAGVPNIDYSLTIMPTDNQLISDLTTGTSGSGAGGDIYSVDYATRYMNTNSLPFGILVKDPTKNGVVIFSITGGQPVFDSIDESGTSNDNLTAKYSGKDNSGNIVISATNPIIL